MTKRLYSNDETHRTVKGVNQKYCPKCQKWKGENQYYRNRRSNDGLQWRCKECESKYFHKRYERIRKCTRRNLRYEDRHRVVNEIKQKYCLKCKSWKSESEFFKDRSRKDGLMERCKKCKYKPAKKSRKRRSN